MRCCAFSSDESVNTGSFAFLLAIDKRSRAREADDKVAFLSSCEDREALARIARRAYNLSMYMYLTLP